MSWIVGGIGVRCLDYLPVDQKEQTRLIEIKRICERTENLSKVTLTSSIIFGYICASYIFPMNYFFGASLILGGLSGALASYDLMLVSKKIGQTPEIIPSLKSVQKLFQTMERGLKSSVKANSMIFEGIDSTIEKIDGTVSELLKGTSFLTKALSNNIKGFITGWLLIGSSVLVDRSIVQKLMGLGNLPHLKHLQNGLSRIIHAVESVFLQISVFFAMNAAILALIMIHSVFPVITLCVATIFTLMACISRDFGIVMRNVNKEIINHESVSTIASISEGIGLMGALKTACYGATNTSPLTTLRAVFTSQDSTQFTNNLVTFFKEFSLESFEKLLVGTSPLINNFKTRQYFKNFVEKIDQ